MHPDDLLLFASRRADEPRSGFAATRTHDGAFELSIVDDGEAMAARFTPEQTAQLAISLLLRNLDAAQRVARTLTPEDAVTLGLALAAQTSDTAAALAIGARETLRGLALGGSPS